MPDSPVNSPAFWIAFLLIEAAIQMIVPNRRWAGAIMLVVGFGFLASAFGWIPFIAGPLDWHRPILLLVLILLSLGAWACILWAIVQRISTTSDRLPAPHDAPMATFMGSVVAFKNFPPGISKDQTQVEFWTNNNNSRLVVVNGHTKKLRFIKPSEKMVCDLPAFVPCKRRWFGRRGRLVIKQFTDTGFTLEEQNTKGEEVVAEIYYD